MQVVIVVFVLLPEFGPFLSDGVAKKIDIVFLVFLDNHEKSVQLLQDAGAFL